MKLAKLTLDGYFNYGNILQNYALEQVLLRYADQVETIWHIDDNFSVNIRRPVTLKRVVKWVLNWKGARDTSQDIWNRYEVVRQAKNKEFCDRFLHYRYIGKEGKTLADIADTYDFFVVGSDQVWNPWFADLGSNFLQFAPRGKRVSYAASIACPEIPEKLLPVYREGLRGMAAISVREQEAADMVQSLVSREAAVHVDPTLLLDASEWRAISREPAWAKKEKEYILTYFLGPMPESVREVAMELGLPLVNMLDVSSYEHYIAGVDEFLWALDHAALVYTDSFHGTVFSILFQRPFVVCNRQADHANDQTSGKMSSRIDTLLGLFGFEGRRARREDGYRIAGDPLSPPDWFRCAPVLERERARSDAYLRNALRIDA